MVTPQQSARRSLARHLLRKMNDGYEVRPICEAERDVLFVLEKAGVVDTVDGRYWGICCATKARFLMERVVDPLEWL